MDKHQAQQKISKITKTKNIAKKSIFFTKTKNKIYRVTNENGYKMKAS
jgi:hypothetical protein